MSPVLVEAYAAEIPRLEAQESLRRMTEIAVGTGSVKAEDSRRIVRSWEQAVVGAVSGFFSGLKLFVLEVWRGIVIGVADAVNGVIGVINGFIEAYNTVATKLGLPLLGKIEMVTPNLADIDRAIDDAARDRTSVITTIQRTVYEETQANLEHRGLTAAYASGTDHITRGPEIFVAGEAGPEHVRVTPLSGGAARLAAEGDGDGAGHGHPIVMDGHQVARLIGRRYVRGAAAAGGAIG